ncbi:MAG: DnaJ domain-containing protein [Synechococcales cyanobacterium T60_A2020_003]|nr:DnaJ domain-containing protein [Synechococcales cyanobacterium T60_A2020_003]
MPPIQDYYDILNVPRTATLAEIKQAFRRLARQYHPDLSPDNPNAEAIFKKICEAYEIIQDHACKGRPRSSDQSPEDTASQIDAYVAGVQYMLDQNYLAALNCFSEAIAQAPNFAPAYLKRCQVYLYLANYRAVLRDCQQLLILQPDSAEGYYYRGRARYRLGYIQSAIDAYDRAIALDPLYATAYYHRGVAYVDLKNQSQAIDDLQIAAKQFQTLGDRSGYQLAQKTLHSIRNRGLYKWRSLVTGLVPALVLVLRAIPWILMNPETQLLTTFQHLQRYQIAAGTGIGLAIAAVSLFTLGVTMGWQSVVPMAWPEMAFIGCIVAISLVLVSAIARWAFDRRTSSLSGDCFVVGVALLPLGILPLIGAVLLGTGTFSVMAIALVAFWYAGLLLYLGFTKVQDIPSGYAAMLVPLVLLLSSRIVRLIWLFSGA